MGISYSNLDGAEGIYRTLLRLYPPAFRRRFGVDMLQVFRESYSWQMPRPGTAAWWDFWVWTIEDLLRSLLGEWWQAIIRLNKVELPIQRWADSLIVPLIVFGTLLGAGNLGAVLVRDLAAPGAANASAGAWNEASMLAAALGVAGVLGALGILSALVVVRNRRAESWIKL
jgi:hypothetical protein